MHRAHTSPMPSSRVRSAPIVAHIVVLALAVTSLPAVAVAGPPLDPFDPDGRSLPAEEVDPYASTTPGTEGAVPPPDPAGATPTTEPAAPAPVAEGPADVSTPEEAWQLEKTSEGLLVTGAVFGGLAVGSWLLVALPALGLAEHAEDRALDDNLLVSDEELYARSKRRRDVARGAAWVGVASLGVGLVILGAGLGVRSKAKKARRSLSFHAAPSLAGDGFGVGGSFRF